MGPFSLELKRKLWVTGALATYVVMAWGTAASSAATSDGGTFPCTDEFANHVVADSGFVAAANAKTQNHYSDPRYWAAAQTVCADFDGDGSEEMVASLSSMGGTEPWAFFDIPSGRATEATFSFPTITGYSGPLYANHSLELVHVGSLPAIRDTRRLFRHSDAHCCPTGGSLIRIVGFAGASYRVLASEIQRPPSLHEVRLPVGLARNAAARFLDRRYEETWTNRSGGRINCNRRLSFNVRRCEIGYVIGDLGIVGPVRISLYERGPGDRVVRIHYRLTQIDEYCIFGLHKSFKECSNVDRGSMRFRL